jgi:hypothetical protein
MLGDLFLYQSFCCSCWVAPCDEWNAQSPRQIFKISGTGELVARTSMQNDGAQQSFSSWNTQTDQNPNKLAARRRYRQLLPLSAAYLHLQNTDISRWVANQALLLSNFVTETEVWSLSDSLFCKWRHISLSVACGDYVSAVFRSLFLHKRKTRIVQRRGVTTRCIIVV